MWAKLQKLLHTSNKFAHLLQYLTEKVIQVIDILINFAPKSI
jgi:hypothetical protein